MTGDGGNDDDVFLFRWWSKWFLERRVSSSLLNFKVSFGFKTVRSLILTFSSFFNRDFKAETSVRSGLRERGPSAL